MDAVLPSTITEAAAALREGTTSSVELTRAGYARADALDPTLSVYASRFDDAALAAAQRADDDLAAGVDRGPLHGIPIGIKDIMLTSEGPTGAGSLVRNAAWEVRRDGRAVAGLRAAGAVITGKLTTMEFATGAPDPDGPIPLPRNPWDPGRWAGGSSSGSGNGVAAAIVLGALGSDTAGSIRLPAAYCGVCGLKPTFGRVSQDGVIPLSTTFDCVGPLTRTAADAALMLQAIAGHRPGDASTFDVAVPGYAAAALERPWEGVRIGVVRADHLDHEALDPAVGEAFEAAVAVLADAGATLTEVTLPDYPHMVDANMITLLADALAYHHRHLREQWDRFQAATRLAYASAVVFSSGDYARVQKVRRAIRGRVGRLFEDVDLLVTPTTASAAPAAGREIEVAKVMASIFTPYWSATGHPALSAPMGFADGLPLGLQLVGRPFHEGSVLRAAAVYQERTDWHLRRPPTLQTLGAQHA